MIKKSSDDNNWSIVADNSGNTNEINYIANPHNIFVSENNDIYIIDKSLGNKSTLY